MKPAYFSWFACIVLFIAQAEFIARSQVVAPFPIWGTQAGGAGSDSASAVKVDGAGNIYIAGNFSGVAAFGPFSLTNSSAGSSDAFIAKLGMSGNFVWVRQAQKAASKNPLCIDAFGNSYLAGRIAGTATIGSVTLSGGGEFVAKYDANGTVLWATQLAGGNGFSSVTSVSADSMGNVFAVGYFTDTRSFGNLTLTSSGSYDAFVAKLDANGNVLWTRSVGGTGSDGANAVSVDAAGNSYVAGNFFDAASFGGIILTNPFGGGTAEIFIAKLDANGNFLWAKQAGGTTADTFGSVTDDAFALCLDKAGNVLVAGVFAGNAQFGSFTLVPSAAGEGSFVAKLNSSGTFLWAKKADILNAGYSGALSVDDEGNAYLAGHYANFATFGSVSLTFSGGVDGFVARISSSGTWQWARRLGAQSSTSSDHASAVCVDSFGDIFIAGEFEGNPQYGNNTLTNRGLQDASLVKLGTPPAITAEPLSQTVTTGASVAFNIAVKGSPPLTYQWRKDGFDIPGATNASLVLTNVQPGAAGGYSTKISNSLGDAYSSTASLSVNLIASVRPALTAPAWNRPTGFSNTASVEIGAFYRVQSSTNLVNWTDLTNFTATAASAQIRDAAATNMARRFYRVVSP